MPKTKNDQSTERTRTPGTADGERDTSEQNDGTDEKITGQTDDDEEFEDDEDEDDSEDVADTESDDAP